MVRMDRMKKLTFWVNTGLMCIVATMTGAFVYYGVNVMVYQSVPTALMYVGMYGLIRKGRLDVYVLMTYILITAYMVTATVCLGTGAGYLLYCMSLIPLSFYMEYMGEQLHTRKINARVTSGILVALFLGLTWYAHARGPLYEVEDTFLFRCMVGNAIGVFAFLIGYTGLVTRMVRDSERQLSEMAHTDRLTGLFNRHYLMSYLDGFFREMPPRQWVAMIDVDGFKDINDTYGHHGGDYVLAELARMMREACPGCVIGRWGGEEFLIVADGAGRDTAMLEALREAVAERAFIFEGVTIPVTVTVGVSVYEGPMSLDRWIQEADRKLYLGKGNGKNQVVY